MEEHEVWRLTQLASSTCRVVVTSRSSLTTESIYHKNDTLNMCGMYTDVATKCMMAIELMFNEDYFMYTMDQNDYLQ